MKTSVTFIIFVTIISGAFFGILSMMSASPQSIMEWIISDALLGIILYLGYLVSGIMSSSSKTRITYSSK